MIIFMIRQMLIEVSENVNVWLILTLQQPVTLDRHQIDEKKI